MTSPRGEGTPTEDDPSRTTRARPRAPQIDADLAAPPEVAWPTLTLLTTALALSGVALALSTQGQRVAAGLAVYLAGWMAFTVLHEAAHGNLGRSRWLNALAGELAASMLLCRFLAFRQIHQRHHRFTNDRDRDPDRFTGAGPRWQRALRIATTDLHYYFEYSPKQLRASPVETRLSIVSAVLLVAVLVCALALGRGVDVVLIWILPIRASMATAALFVDYLPHMRPLAPSRDDDPLRHTAQLAPSPLVDALLLSHSHHLLHHLWPRVPFYRLPRVWRRHGDALRARGAVVRWG